MPFEIGSPGILLADGPGITIVMSGTQCLNAPYAGKVIPNLPVKIGHTMLLAVRWLLVVQYIAHFGNIDVVAQKSLPNSRLSHAKALALIFPRL